MKRMVPKEELVAKQIGRHYGRVKTRRSVSFGNALRRITSMLLCLCMMAAMLCNLGGWVLSSAVAAEATGNVMNRIADGDTSDTYIGKLLSSEWGSRYAGRVWTDKSVFAFGNNINLDMDTDGYPGTVKFNSDFGTIFSALASSQRINEYPPSPIDLVILIDMSGSMAVDIVGGASHTHDDYTDQNGLRVTHSRIYAVLESINKSIQEVMDMGEADRVAVVAYGATAYTLMELGHYETPTDGKYLEVKNFRTYGGNSAPGSAGNRSAAYMVGTVAGLKKINEDGVTYSNYGRYARNDYLSSKLADDPVGTVNIGYHTDLQAGIYQGFEELYKHYNSKEDVTKTYVSADTGTKTVVQRIPVAIVMTDGGSNYALQPTTGATGDEWYHVPIIENNVSSYTGNWRKYRTESLEGDRLPNNASGTPTNDRGGDATIVDILMTASYEKAKVQKKYAKYVLEAKADKDNPLEEERFKGTDLRVLTVSVDTPDNEWQKPRVYTALDPVHFFNEDPKANGDIDPSKWVQKNDVINAYKLFKEWEEATGTVSTTFTDSDTIRTVKFNQLPPAVQDIDVTKEDVVNNINYNTRFADISSSALTDTFDNMLNEIRGIAFTPLSGDNASGVADSITYQDPLGEYMELKNGAITVEKDKVGNGGEVTGSNETTFDMSMLLYGEMHGLVRAGVYDYQWNNDYMRKNKIKTGYPKKDPNPDEDPLEIGWYKGDALTAEYSYNKETGLPDGCKTAKEAWAAGWVLRLNYKTLAEFVPISGITDTMKPTEVPEQIQHTAYTCYRFADSQEERNKLRRNPIFGAVPDSLQKEWEDYFKEYGSYPVGMDKYSDYSGVYRLSDIRVWTEHTGDFVDQTGAITPEEESGYDDSLYVNIPVSAVPTQLAEITLGGEGPISYKDNLNEKEQSTPLRLFYAVGLTEDLIQRDADGNQTGVDVSKISGEYIASHSDPETNNISFISNWYSNTAYRGYTSDAAEEYRTRGDAAVTFSPNAKNRYYLFQKPLPLIAHAYRVTNDDGDVAPVDNAENKDWKANGAGNGETKWENGETGGATWSGGEFIGTYESETAFKTALKAAMDAPDSEGKCYITDAKKYTYRLPDDITDAVITYTKDQLSKVDSEGSGYTTDSLSFSSDDYFFLCIEYYLPMDGTGKDIYGQEDPDTQAVRKISRMIARKGSAFGSGLHSEYIDNGDMLCWTDINGNCNLEIEYNSRTDTGDDTRGRPTLEKLTYTGDNLLNYLKDTCNLNTEPEVGEQSYLDLDYAYWTSVQADPHMAALIEEITALDPGEQQAKFDELFDWSVAARTSGIRVGDMFNNMQAKQTKEEADAGKSPTLGADNYYPGNVTHTANNYYIPTLSETSTAGDGLVINNYLGNNGRLEVANATLMVTKTLVAPGGFTLTEEQQNETFNYQVYVQGLTGERLAQRLKWNPFSQSWQKRVETLDILTDNSSLLVDTSGNRALFCCTEGAEPTQIVEVFEDGAAKYYYADATGAATKEPCNDSSEHFYYLYLPDSAGEENYHLFASTYEGTTKLDGVGTTAYYPVGTDESKLKGDNENQTFAQAVTGSADSMDDRPAGSREYWTKEAELIPYNEVAEADTGTWEYNPEQASSYKKVEEPFTLVTVIPDPEGTDSTVYSPYRSRTQYMSTELYFGYNKRLAEHLKECKDSGSFAGCTHLEDYKLGGGDLYDQIVPTADRPDLFTGLTNDTITKNTAEFTLKSGEGLLFTGLGNRIPYRFTEKLTDEQMQKGYTLKEISHVQQRGSDSVYRPGIQNVPVYSHEGATYGPCYPEGYQSSETENGLTWALNQEGNTNEEEYLKYEPFAHTNAVMWEYYATMGAAELGNHHHPADAGNEDSTFYNQSTELKQVHDPVEPNPSCKTCDKEIKDSEGNVTGYTHYMYRDGVLVDPHYEGEASAFLRNMSRYLVSPTVHFGVNNEETYASAKPGTFSAPETGYYDYNGVYSVFGNTGYFSEQAHYINTVDPELFVLTKALVDMNGNIVSAPPNQEFTFTLTFEPTDGAAMTAVDNTLHYWKGNKDTWRSSETWVGSDGKTYKMPETVPKLDAYEPYLTDDTFRLASIEPEGDGTTRTYQITLKANEAVVFYGLLAGTKFTVTEEANEKYPVVPGKDDSDAGYTQTGMIYRASEDPSAMDPVTTPNRAEFTNQLKTGVLTIEKKILDEDADTVDQEFGFTVTLTAGEGETLDQSKLTAVKYKADNTVDGEFSINWTETVTEGSGVTALTATFDLKHGEKISIDGIPLDTEYTVEETQKDGYNLQHVAGNPENAPDGEGNYLPLTGDSVSGSIGTTASQVYLLFANEKALFLPFVGGIGIGAIVFAGVLLIGLATMMILQKKLKRRRNA